jgi:serine/threonine protein kinase
MSLDNLDQGAALDRCVSNNSLSGALLRENTNVSSSDACSPRTAIDKILSELVDDNSSSTKLDSWRDSIGWNTRRSTERPNVGKASSTNSLLALAQNQLFQSHEVQRLVNQTTADLTADLTAIKRMSLTYEVIAAILSFKTVLDLSMFEKETLFSVKTASKAKSKPDPYEDSNKQKGILMRPELNSGQCKLYMYAVREFLDSGVCDKDVPFLSMSASHVGACYFRLLKLCSRRFFANSCLPGHLQEGDKIGTGAFGSVHRVSCPQSCSSHAGGGHTVEYAVKRMPRERSLQDEGVLFGVLTEVTCLEMMSDHRGVCDIVNYGVHGNQYWMVLELGMCNLQEWAEELTHQEVLLLSTGKQEQLDGGLTELEVGECASAGIDKLLLKLCIFYEMISILNDVHKKNIIHFDIKCSNFMFRKSPQLDDFLGTVLDNLSSGVLFLTDFGEALQLSEDIDLKLKQRSRGTLAIQSPEMLCVSESGSGLAQSMKLGVESTDEKTKVEINTPSAASDCWSMGCALFELMTGSHLFEGQSFTEMFCLLCKEDFVLPDIAACLVAKGVQPTSVPAIPNCCKALADIIALELVQSPLKRPPLTDLMAATADMIKSMLPFRSGPRNSTADGGPDSIKKQESYSPFYHMKDSSSPFRLVTDEAAPLLGSQTGVVGGSSGRGVHTFTNNDQVDFLDGVKTTSQAPPLAKDCSRDLSAASISSVHCSTVASAQGVLGYSAETVHLSPGTWQFSSSVSLVVSESFAVPFPDATTPIGLDDLYGNMDIKINSIIKNQPVDDDLDASELQSRAVALKDFNMKRSLLLCLRRQFESMSLEATSSCPSPLQSPHDIAKCFKEPKVCHINISMAGADTTPALSVKSAGGIAATSTELPAGPTAKRGTDTVFETSNVSVYRCEVASDPDHAADVLKNAFKFAKLKHGEGFRVQFCVEASAHAGISMSSILSAEHEGSKDKIEVSQSALAAASLLGTLLRHQPVRTTSICTSSDDHSCNDRGTADLYLEKHFPWILTLVDRRMLRTLQVELEEML